MKKKVIRLTESDLHKIIKNTVNKVIRESKRTRKPLKEFIDFDDMPSEDNYEGRMDTVNQMIASIPEMSDEDLQSIVRGNAFNGGAGHFEYEELMKMAKRELMKRQNRF